MGVCASCLNECFGVGEKDDHERDGLLADGGNNGYNSYQPYGPPSPTGGDPLQRIHESEYLERLVAQTSENLIDIFAPPRLIGGPSTMMTGAPPSMSATPSSRGEWYRTLLESTTPPPVSDDTPVVLDPGSVGEEERKWLEMVVRKGEETVREIGKVKEVGRLVVGLDMD